MPQGTQLTATNRPRAYPHCFSNETGKVKFERTKTTPMFHAHCASSASLEDIIVSFLFGIRFLRYFQIYNFFLNYSWTYNIKL